MRTVPIAAALFLAACTPSTPSAPASGANVTSRSTTVGAETEVDVEITPGSEGRLIVALGDRISDIDLTPAQPSASASKLGDALVGFAPVKANEPVHVRVRARPWSGADVLESFIVPFGGDAATTALAAASPEFAKGKMIAVQVDIMSASSTQTTIHNLLIASGERPGASTRYDVDGVVAMGTPLRVQDWVMAAADGFTPAIHQEGSTLRASGAAQETPLEALPAAVWTLWVQLEPAGT